MRFDSRLREYGFDSLIYKTSILIDFGPRAGIDVLAVSFVTTMFSRILLLNIDDNEIVELNLGYLRSAE